MLWVWGRTAPFCMASGSLFAIVSLFMFPRRAQILPRMAYPKKIELRSQSCWGVPASHSLMRILEHGGFPSFLFSLCFIMEDRLPLAPFPRPAATTPTTITRGILFCLRRRSLMRCSCTASLSVCGSILHLGPWGPFRAIPPHFSVSVYPLAQLY